MILGETRRSKKVLRRRTETREWSWKKTYQLPAQPADWAGPWQLNWRQLAGGRRPRVGELLLTPANARRVAEQLAQMRGAAMKVGQLLSMDGGDLLPPELSEILSRLRSDARPMPMSQLVPVLALALAQNWGEGWERHFRRFSFTPMAAASIGQVHAAEARDGSRLAIKVQYPASGRALPATSTTLLACCGSPACCQKPWTYQASSTRPNSNSTRKPITCWKAPA